MTVPQARRMFSAIAKTPPAAIAVPAMLRGLAGMDKDAPSGVADQKSLGKLKSLAGRAAAPKAGRELLGWLHDAAEGRA